MIDATPKVTVGVPVFNGSSFIIETLESVCKQTFPNIELVIIDDCSTDGSFELCVDWLAKTKISGCAFQNPENAGITVTANRILSRASGKYFQLLGHDDILLPGKIAVDVDLMERADPETGFVFSNVSLIDIQGKLTGQHYFQRIGFKGLPSESVYKQLINQNFIASPAVLMNTALVRKVGGYDESLVFEDWDMWLRLAKDYKTLYHPDNLSCYRIHGGSVMADNDPQKTIIRNDSNYRMFLKHLNPGSPQNEIIMKKLQEISIYSFFIGDENAFLKLKESLKRKFNLKLFAYAMMSRLGLKHPSKLFSR